MEEKKLLCVLIKDNYIYNVGGDSIFKQDKNCYIITKYGSTAQPVIHYDKKIDGSIIYKNKYIGGYIELINFLSDKFTDRIYLRGFNRATIDRIFRLLLENKTSKINEVELASDDKVPVRIRTRSK